MNTIDCYRSFQENIRINGPTYHWKTKRGKRKQKEERWRMPFTNREQQHLRSYHWSIPSPKGSRIWMHYIDFRFAMMAEGMAVYATRKYARLSFDKYVESNRASDLYAAQLTKRKPSMIYLGAAEMAPNSPIGIRKHLRVPGTRKLMASFKKLGNCVILFVDEYYTSQTCAKCFARFDRRTRRNRFKICQQCEPDERALLPGMIISKVSNRELRKRRKEEREFIEQQQQQQQQNVNQPHVAVNPTRPSQKQRLVSKVQVFFKRHANEDGDLVYVADRKTVWHRDIVAAKCILYKGKL